MYQISCIAVVSICQYVINIALPYGSSLNQKGSTDISAIKVFRATFYVQWISFVIKW